MQNVLQCITSDETETVLSRKMIAVIVQMPKMTYVYVY